MPLVAINILQMGHQCLECVLSLGIYSDLFEI